LFTCLLGKEDFRKDSRERDLPHLFVADNTGGSDDGREDTGILLCWISSLGPDLVMVKAVKAVKATWSASFVPMESSQSKVAKPICWLARSMVKTETGGGSGGSWICMQNTRIARGTLKVELSA
jgi:hypothetical protein